MYRYTSKLVFQKHFVPIICISLFMILIVAVIEIEKSIGFDLGPHCDYIRI